MSSKASYQTRIKARINELKMTIAAAQAELHDLQVAEKVLERLSDSGLSPMATQDVGIAALPRSKEPTVADKAIEALRERGPMNTVDLLACLQMTWREDLAQTTLSSTLSRVKKDGLIDYVDGLWCVPDGDPLADLIGKPNSTSDGKPGQVASDVDVFD